ncbi:unnamed protein product, partial [Meganyctiphanes norvegica]|uniref:Major facilitator superfamily (MFS) profile domain-containing protein n=1 Tax=Meganyctiphanes norvegica TaxID=48144 RepID=A0AAV2SNK9_MEGNR
MPFQLTGRQWSTLVVLCTSNICVYAASALLPPFYPALAENNGPIALQYGFVFGMFRLVIGIISPVYGRYIGTVGPRFMLTAGLFTAAGTCALMGFINNVYGYASFLGLPFVVQVVAALGSATVPNAITLLVNKEFPNCTGTVFALTEIAIGLGLIMSPLIGGLLQFAGYSAPFVTASCVLVVAAFMTVMVLPERKLGEDHLETESTITVLDILKQPSMVLFLMSIIMGAFTYGFLWAGLGQHLIPLQLSTLHTGLAFVLGSSVHCVSVSIWGFLCDTLICPATVTMTCTALICIGVLLLGPAPFIPLELNLPMCLVAIAVIMASDPGQVVGGFSGLFRAAEECRLPKDTATQGILGGWVNTAYNLGSFLGFNCAGFFIQTLGYRWTTMVILCLQLTLLLITSIYYLCKRHTTEHQPLLQGNNSNDAKSSLHSSYGAI